MLRSAKNHFFAFFGSKNRKKAFWAFWAENTSQNHYVYKVNHASARRSDFSDFLFFQENKYFPEKCFFIILHFYHFRKNLFHIKCTFKKCWYFLGNINILDHFSVPERFFRSFSENSQQNGKMLIFVKKCDFFEIINFLVSGIPFPAPSLKSLRNQCFFRCFGLHFPPFRIFH